MPDPLPQSLDIARLLERCERERMARKEAERYLEEKSRLLFESNKQLKDAFNGMKAAAESTRAILENMPNGVFVTNDVGEVLELNAMATARFGITADSSKGRLLADFLPSFKNLSDSTVQGLFHSYAQQTALARTDTGEEFPCEVSATPITPDKIVWMVRDISARVQAEQRQRQLEADLRQAQRLESLGTMAGGVAHELNTPIQFVSDNAKFLQTAFSDLLAACQELKLKVEPAYAEAISQTFDLEYLQTEVPKAIMQSIEGLARISEIVLAIKRFSHPSSAIKEANDLNEIIRTTTMVTKNQWKYLAEVDVDLAQDLPPLMSNAGELNQVFLNLIVNAAHAIEERSLKGRLGKITISTRQIDGGIECRVQDNGNGIPAANLQRIFDLFFTTKPPGRGTGQGLALAHSIICNSHGGRIDVESQVGEGSTFIIRLPFDGTGAKWNSNIESC